jgi:hypothetical protein
MTQKGATALNHDKFYKLPVMLLRRRDLNGTDKLILAIIMDRIGKNGRCWPGIKCLAADAGVSRKTVIESVRRLEQAGDIIIENKGQGSRNYYHLARKSCVETTPDPNSDLCRNVTGSCVETTPEVVTKLHMNQTDPGTRPTIESKPSSLAAQEIVTHWNAQVNLPKVQKLTPGRRKKLETRLRDPDFAANCLAVIEQINRTPFLTGDNDRGWKASLDWLAGNEDNWVKVSEGRYENNRPSGGGWGDNFSIYDHPELLRDPNDDPELMAELSKL